MHSCPGSKKIGLLTPYTGENFGDGAIQDGAIDPTAPFRGFPQALGCALGDDCIRMMCSLPYEHMNVLTVPS